MSSGVELRVALAGNPNAGKTTLFNRLTGARQHVGNYPGITVDTKEGSRSYQGRVLRFIDLPGTYSLTAYSEEELVARDFLVMEAPDVVVNVVDASNLERNLYLTTQFIELGVRVVIALNMIDVAADRGITVDHERLARLLDIPVVPIVARSGEGLETLLDTIVRQADASGPGRDRQAGALPPPGDIDDPPPGRIRYGDDIDRLLIELVAEIEERSCLTDLYPARWTALKLMEDDEQMWARLRAADPDLAAAIAPRIEDLTQHLRQTLDTYPEAVIADHRYGFIKSLLRGGVVRHKFDIDRLYTSDRIDKVVTNRFLGPLIMVGVLYGLYTFTFTYSAWPVSLCEGFFAWLASSVENLMAPGPLRSLLVSGVIDGAGGVLGFVPLIMFMFFGIAVLEDSGYLARVAFMMDRVFRVFGLHGSSVMPFIISGGIAGGCAVPGVMATRTLRSPRERMATLLTVPFMNCGAKVPVLALFIAAFFPAHKALYMFVATLGAWAVALLAARLLRSTVLRGEPTPFVMELPPYRFPTFQGLLIHTWERTWQYIRKAGTVILAISVLLWAMMSWPGLPADQETAFEARRMELAASLAADRPALEEALAALERDRAAAALSASLAGRIGRALEPLSTLAGFDWRANIALLGGFAAKEVILSTLGTVYSLGDADGANLSLGERLRADPAWDRVRALAVLVFIMFYAPCFVTLTAIAREAGSWRWALFSMAFNTIIAFVLAVAVYQVGRAAG